MSVDKQELRRLAADAIFGHWFKSGDLRYSDDKTGEVRGLNVEDDRFIAAANPAAILSLLDELEQYRKDALRYRFIADNAADVIMSASATDCGDGDTTFGPRAEIDLCQYPVEMFGSAKIKLDFAVDAAMAKEQSQ